MNQPPIWRLLITPPAAGAWNMAVDEAIAAHAGRGETPPTLRFYQWQPACVSLGRHQPLADIDLARCAALGYDLVRRPTGGRAILHTDELTYSVAGRQEDPLLAGAVLDSYLRLSQGLLVGLEGLGLRVAKAPPSGRANADAGPVCFEVPSAYEIVAGGKKLVGSAQSRRGGWVLQHGTLPLVGDVTRLVEVVVFPDEAERSLQRELLAGRATTVEAALGRVVNFDEAAKALAAGFGQALGIHLEAGELSPGEIAAAEALQRQVYGHEEWTGRH
ncbi:MAG TPA: lipoate--protein ligase family protein [Anaerolineae bacterium]|nr:lipoate--protein ligase family protein [Anaerolineae bacterium]